VVVALVPVAAAVVEAYQMSGMRTRMRTRMESQTVQPEEAWD